MKRKNLQRILDNHELWLKTDGQEGKQANLKRATLEIKLETLHLDTIHQILFLSSSAEDFIYV